MVLSVKSAAVCFPYKFTLLSNFLSIRQRPPVVCFPYKFTLLSNWCHSFCPKVQVCFPYEFTLLSNNVPVSKLFTQFVSPTNLHCSQTMMWTMLNLWLFVSPTNLHCSQTIFVPAVSQAVFVSPTNLHCSQTGVMEPLQRLCLFPLRIYTALKQMLPVMCRWLCLFPLRIYTALKQALWNHYNAYVCFPYEFTLLSNHLLLYTIP